MASLFQTLEAGTVLCDRYVVVRLLKSGGQGAVYEVQDRISARRRALKVLHPDVIRDHDMLKRFEREAKVTGPIESEHLVDVFDAGLEPKLRAPFLVMEYLRGRDLGSLLDECGPLPPAEALAYLGQIAVALDKTHAAGIIHRDLKPENVFLTMRDDGSPRVKVLDFGIAKIVAQASGPNTRVLGTPMTMSPEQLKGEAALGPATDVYALGLVAFNLLVGKPYFWHEASALELHALLLRIMLGLPEKGSVRAARYGQALPPVVDDWLERTCAVEPALRPSSAGEAIAELAALLTRGAEPKAEPPRVSASAKTARQLPGLFETTSSLAWTGQSQAFALVRRAVRDTTPLPDAAIDSANHGTSMQFSSAATPRLPRPRRGWGLVAGVLGAVVAGTSAFVLWPSEAPQAIPVPPRGLASVPQTNAVSEVAASASPPASVAEATATAAPASSASAKASGTASKPGPAPTARPALLGPAPPPSAASISSSAPPTTASAKQRSFE